ncbi:MAG: sulfotransferase domain-containing protein [Planctomycetota bacterium]
MTHQNEKRFFCIRGHMKSGTNWICRLLNLHPDIHCLGEFHWHNYFEAYEKNRRTFVFLDRVEEQQGTVRRGLENFVRQSMVSMARPDARLIGDRTPHTIHPVVMRDAPHISVVRDIRDIVVSKMFHYYNAPRIFGFFEKNPEMVSLKEKFKADPWYFQKHPYRLLCHEFFVRHTCRKWIHFLKADRNTARNRPGLPVHFVQYESVHGSIREELDAMFVFLGVDPAMSENIPANLMPGHKSEKPDKFNRKGAVGDWRNYMTPEAKKWINEEAGPEMIRQGYIESFDWTIDTREKAA